MDPAGPVGPDGEGCRLTVRLTPKSSKDAIEGVEALADGRRVLKARVRAAPEKGKANAALVKLLAKTLDLPASSIRIETGATARLKSVGLDARPDEVAARLGLVLGKD